MGMRFLAFAGVVCLFVILGSTQAYAGGEIIVSVGSATEYIEPNQDLPNSGTPLGWTARVYNLAQDNGKGDTGNGDGTGNWQTNGRLGLGYADGDDVTAIEADGSVRSVYTRTAFEVANAAGIVSMILEVDYDDGYVAWLNGTEISRSANMTASPPLWNSAATSGHEATHKYGDADRRQRVHRRAGQRLKRAGRRGVERLGYEFRHDYPSAPLTL
jgi:hypothetical protein